MLTAEIDPDLPTKILLDGPHRLNGVIQTIPGALFSAPSAGPGKGKLPQAWRSPLSWQVCLALRTSFGQELEIGPNLRAWAVEYKNTIIDPALGIRMSVDEEIDAPGFDKLFSYQRAGVKFLAATKRAILTDGMGAGKTAQSIATLRYIHEVEGINVFPALVVAPNSTLLSWEREIEKWWPGKTVNVVKGSAIKRRKLLETEADFYVINWEGLRAHSRLAKYGNIAIKRCPECGGQDAKVKPAQCQKHEKELNAIDFQSAIGDEIHRIKDGRTATARALKAATDTTDIKLALSGTPIANNPGDLWSPLNWILPDAYPSRDAYVKRYMEMSFNPWGGQEISGIKTQMEPEFYAGIDPHLRHMPKELVLSFLPPKVYERRDVEMNPRQAKAYKQMSEKMIAGIDENNTLITTSPMIKAMRLAQLASTLGEVEEWTEMVYNEETGETEPRLRQKLHLTEPSCKLDAFMDDLPDFEGESIVVFAVSRQLLELLSVRLEKQGIKHGIITGTVSLDDRQQHMDDFQEGRTKIILVSTAAGGTGITLTAASIAAFLQRPWSLVESEQAEARVHRIGSEIHDFIRIIDYVTVDSIEETVFPVLEEKGGHLEKILRSNEALYKMLTEFELPDKEDDLD